MANTTHVINYIANIDAFKKSVKNLEDANRTLATNFAGDFARANRIIAQTLTPVSTEIKKVGQGENIREVVTAFQTLNTVVQTTDGKIQQISQRFTEMKVNTETASKAEQIMR